MCAIVCLQGKQSKPQEREEKDMRYIVEDWETEEVIKVFDSEEERSEWIKKRCTSFNDGVFITSTETRISCYEK